MKKLLILLFTFGVGSAFAGQKFVIKSTFGAFKEEDEKVLLQMSIDGNTDGIMALVRQGKCIPLQRGIGGLWVGQDEINGLDMVIIPNDQKNVMKDPGRESKQLWIPRKFLTGQLPLPPEEETASVTPDAPFSIASLPRLPIHFPAKRMSDDEVVKAKLREYDRQTARQAKGEINGDPDIVLSRSPNQYNEISQSTESAILKMMHYNLENNWKLIKPYVVYGPIADDHNDTDASNNNNTWLVEVQFSLPPVDGAPVDTKVYTAVLHAGATVLSCQLGEDKPTLKAEPVPEPTPMAMPTPTPDRFAPPQQETQADSPPIDQNSQTDSFPTGQIASAPISQSGGVAVSSGDQRNTFLSSVIHAMESYDWQTLTTHFVDGHINYFGHRNASINYIIRDIQSDARIYGRPNYTCYWDTFKHEISQEFSAQWSGPMIYDSVNVYAVIEEKGGRTHHAMERLTVGYTFVNNQLTIYSLTLKVLHS